MTAGKIIAGIVLAPIVILIAGIGGCEARKAYYDRQVRQMCEKDGGITVFERVTITALEYKRLGGTHGQIPVPEERSAPADYPFVSNSVRTVLKEGALQITRTEALIKRRVDGKNLARFVSYARVGGDFPSWAHSSYTLCDLADGNVSRQVFTVEGETK